MDIVVDQDGEKTGFLASSVQEYAIAMTNVLKMPREQRLHMAGKGLRLFLLNSLIKALSQLCLLFWIKSNQSTAIISNNETITQYNPALPPLT